MVALGGAASGQLSGLCIPSQERISSGVKQVVAAKVLSTSAAADLNASAPDIPFSHTERPPTVLAKSGRSARGDPVDLQAFKDDHRGGDSA
jgi:hypothetical protein